MWETLPEIMQQHHFLSSFIVLLIIAIITLVLKSIYSIGPTQVGLVRKRFGPALPEDNPIAFLGEAGYQADLLMPGLRFKFVLVYAVTKHPWVQVPAWQIGIVVAQIGHLLPIGAKSAVYTETTGTVFEGFHIAVASRGETHQGRIDPCLDDAIKTRQITHRSRAENYAADHKPSRRRTSSRGMSSPGSVRAESNLAAVSASMISRSPSSARKEMAT